MNPELYNPGAEDSAVQTFNFNGLTLRAVLVDSEPWVLGADLAEALEYRDAPTLLRGLDDDEKRIINVNQITTQIVRGNPNKIFVNESGLYSAVLKAKTERARPFRKWVTSEVLPAIRRTGEYTAPKSLEERSLALLSELTAEVQKQKAELAVTRPKAEVYDRVLTPEHTFGFRQLCAHLREFFPVNEADVKRVLRERGLLHMLTLTATAKAIDGGWAVQRASGIWGGKERFQPRFTTKTLEWLLTELAPLEDVA